MRCPFCQDQGSHVIDSRTSRDFKVIRRRRECETCKKRFTTYERVEEILPMIIKKDGRREAFDRMKIQAGLTKAIEKRPVTMDQVVKLVDEIEQKVNGLGEKEIQSTFIGEQIMRSLQKTDEVAYVRFASVYRSFKDVNEFMNELKELIRDQRG